MFITSFFIPGDPKQREEFVEHSRKDKIGGNKANLKKESSSSSRIQSSQSEFRDGLAIVARTGSQ